MTGAVYMNFDDDEGPDQRSARTGKDWPGRGGTGTHPWDDDKPGKELIPRAPQPEAPLTGDEVKRGVSDRARTVAKYKELGYSYLEIADLLGLTDAKEAQRIHHSVIAATLSPDSIETQRAIVLARAEALFKNSFAMARAEHLVAEDEDGNPIDVPNSDRLRWHQVAAADMMNIATLTGAKAPTKIEFTPGEADLERMVEEFVRRAGHEDIMDADVLELEQIPDRPDIDDEEF